MRLIRAQRLLRRVLCIVNGHDYSSHPLHRFAYRECDRCRKLVFS